MAQYYATFGNIPYKFHYEYFIMALSFVPNKDDKVLQRIVLNQVKELVLLLMNL
jgi:hypothetical protein